MDALNVIKQLCEKKGVTITQLENDLGYSNGSINKAKSMSADRIYQIAKYFDVQMEYIMTGKTISEADDEMALLRQQKSILMEINKVSQAITAHYKEIAKCQDQLTALESDYNAIEQKKKIKGNDPNMDVAKIEVQRFPDIMNGPFFTIDGGINNENN